MIGITAGLAALGQLILAFDDPRPSPLVPFASALLYFVAVFVILRNIATRPTVDMQAALGAIAAYLCIGLGFAFLYRGIGLWQVEPFFGSQGRGDVSDCAFFSMTTLTTTGYGNLVPARNPGQSFAVLEMIFGQVFLLAAVGKVLADLPRRNRSGRRFSLRRRVRSVRVRRVGGPSTRDVRPLLRDSSNQGQTEENSERLPNRSNVHTFNTNDITNSRPMMKNQPSVTIATPRPP